MKGQLRDIVPILVAWAIWKEYTAIRFGEGTFSYHRLFEAVRTSVYTWCLVATSFSLPLKACRIRVVRWSLPPSGCSCIGYLFSIAFCKSSAC